jgi:hypothetical protein
MNARYRKFILTATLGALLCLACRAEPELQLYGKSLMVYPILMGKEGIPDDPGTQKFGVLIGQHAAMLLEEYGVRPDIATEHPVSVKKEDSLADMVQKFQAFLTERKPTSDYSFFARFHAGPSKHGPVITRICAMLADSGGQIVWSEEQTEFPEEFTPMHGLMKLAEMVDSVSDLKEPDWKNRKQGPFARRMQQQSGLPSPEEYDAMDKRLEAARSSFKDATLTIYPFRIWEQKDGSAAGAEVLAEKLNEAGVFKSAVVAEEDTHLVAKRDPDNPGQPNIIAASARDFRAYLEKHPPATDYALLVDVTVPTHHVHFILCDKTGGWLHFNIANSHHADFKRIQPATVEDCAELAFGRMKEW